MVEMLIFQDLVKHIPAAVFCGVLFKVGYDVFDFEVSAATPFLCVFRKPQKKRLCSHSSFTSRRRSRRGSTPGGPTGRPTGGPSSGNRRANRRAVLWKPAGQKLQAKKLRPPKSH